MAWRWHRWRVSALHATLAIVLAATVAALPARPGAAQADACFAPPTPAEVVVGVSPSSVALGDVNGDGKPDFIVANSASNSVSIQLNCAVGSVSVLTPTIVQSVAEDRTLTFSTASANAVSVSAQFGGSLPIRVTLAVLDGSLSLAGTSGLTFSTGDGAADPAVTFGGMLGSVNAALDGLRYVPNSNFSGTALLTIVAVEQLSGGAEGLASAVAVVPIVVTPVNDPPTAANDAYTVQARTTLNVPAPGVLGNDADIDSTSLTAALVAGPTHGTLTLNPNGGFAYVPNSDFAGTESFTCRASDGGAQSNVAAVAIAVANAAPTAANDTYTIQARTTLTLAAPGVLGNDTDPDASPLTAALVAGPDGGFAYTPNADFAGTDTFTYRASDGIAQSNVATATITATPLSCVLAIPAVGAGRLQVRVEATPLNTQQNNPLRELRFGTLQNATVTLDGQQITSGQTHVVSANMIAVNFAVERATPGQATTVPFTVVDACGDFPTFVGGGTAAGF